MPTTTRRLCHAAAAILCALMLAHGPAAAQPRWSGLTEVSFQHLTQDQGLPSPIATALVEDGEGFLWAGTMGGLARWDGYRFRVWRGDPRTAGALPDNVVQVLHTDRAGRLWVGTSAAGLARYDRASDGFVALSAGPKGLSHVSVRTLADDGSGGLWVGTDGGLDWLDTATGTVRRGMAGLAGQRIHALLRDSAGGLWAGTSAGLFHLPAGATAFAPVRWAAGRIREPTSLAEDSSGCLWIGTLQNGAYVVNPDSDLAEAVTETQPDHRPPLATQPVLSIVEARPGEVWLGTGANGVVAVEVSSRRTHRIRHRATLPLSLADNAVRALHRDRSGQVWVATNRGLSRHDPRQGAVLTLFGASLGDAAAGPDATVSTEISAILPQPDGRLWLGTHKNGIEFIDPRGTRAGALRPDPARPEQALPQDAISGLARTGDAQVWIGTQRGLYRADAEGRTVRRIAWPGRDPAAPSQALLADGRTLWVGGQADGLWRLDTASGRAQTVPATAESTLSDERITVIARADAGRLWVGTRYGLNRFDPGNGHTLAILPEPARAGGLAAGFITALHTDRQQRLWVGTYGGGLHLLERFGSDGRPSFRRIGGAEGLPDDNVGAIVEDEQGQVWVSTDNGLGMIDPATLAVRTLRKAEGVAFAAFWPGSAARTTEGELLFGGAGGMTIVRPERLQRWGYQPPVVVTEVRVGGKVVATGPFAGAAPVRLEVPPHANALAVEFAAADFSSPGRNRYAYWLQGFDTDWQETDAAHRQAAYTNLPPGEYRLRLRGSNREGEWSPREAVIDVHVLPAWHQTLAVRVAAALAAAGALLAVVRWRTGRLRRAQAELEAKVRERTAELEAVSRALHEKSLVLEQSSISDPLTGLRNRRFLTEHIDAEIAASLRRALDAGPVSSGDTDTVFLVIDADHFKRVNDLHGHTAGDAVLVQFARRLQAAMRESDYVVRWGGEEFLAVARDTDRGRAEELAERIRCSIAETPFETEGGRRLAMTCSIGFACVPFIGGQPRALPWNDVVQLADLALLAAKRAGRDAWVGLHAGDHARPEQLRERVEAAPLQAVRNGELRISSSRSLDAVMDALTAQVARAG